MYSIYLIARANMLLHAVSTWINPIDLVYNPYTENHKNDFSPYSWYPNCKFERYENYTKKSIVLRRVLENG